MRNNLYNYGLTLIELLVAAAILGIISVVGVNLIWDTVTSRAKQHSIQDSSENARNLIADISRMIKQADRISITDAHTLKITSQPCMTIIFDTTEQKLKQSLDPSEGCSPPVSDFETMIYEGITLNNIEFSPVEENPSVVNIKIEGVSINSLGEHPFEFDTSVMPRVSI